uniref:Fucolectin-7-like n=1 Tax=Petromyzon marinus TaxID=7757 RepID=A0AAJ7SNR2_PETMA|nr:fucolectin-7-like [Petromyzon marinus]
MKLVLVLVVLVQLGECHVTQVKNHGTNTQGADKAITYCGDSWFSLAIDGNTMMCYNRNELYTSSKGGLDQSWWKLDMHKEVDVYAVNITFKNDNKYKHISSEVHIGMSSDDVTKYVKCKTLEEAAPNTVVTFNCKGVKGRYIFFNFTSYTPLSLYEVQVSTAPLLENGMIVVYGEAMQSSTAGPDHNASKAIDSTNGTNFCSGMCSATSYEWEPWFCITLDDVYTVDAVSITNRDDTEGIRLFGVHIKVGEWSNHSKNALCAGDIFVTPGQSVRFPCQSQLGRYVFIVIPGRMDSLSLCQVKLDVRADGSQVNVVY